MQIPHDSKRILDMAEQNLKLYSKTPKGIEVDNYIKDCFLNIYSPEDFKDFVNIVFNSSLNCSFTITTGFISGPYYCSNIWIDEVTANYDSRSNNKIIYDKEIKTISLTDDITLFPSIIYEIIYDKVGYKDIVIDTSNCSNERLVQILYNFLITYHQRAARILSVVDILHLIEHLIIDDDREFEVQLPFGRGDLYNILIMKYADCRIVSYGVSEYKVKKSIIMFGCPDMNDLKTLKELLNGKSVDIINFEWCEDQSVCKSNNKFTHMEPYFMGVFPSSKLISPNYGIVEYCSDIYEADRLSYKPVSDYIIGNSSNWDYSRKITRNVGCRFNSSTMRFSVNVKRKPYIRTMSNFERDVIKVSVEDFPKIYGGISVARVEFI